MKTSEELIRLADVPSWPMLRTIWGDRPIHLATIYRWVQRGIRGKRLRAVRVGGRGLCTTGDWLGEFFSESALVATVATPVRTSRQRERAIGRAERELAAAGI